MSFPVLVTRPSSHADELIAEIQKLGVSVRHQPLIRIRNFDDNSSQATAIRTCFLNIDNYHTVIAISQNAAEAGLYWLDTYWPQLPMGIQWLAVGPTTKEALSPQIPRIITPVSDFSSEGLLAQPALQADQIEDQKILIWRGVGGRETLANVLTERGAHVDYIELYERQQIQYSEAAWNNALENKPLLILSSGQALDIAEQQVSDLATRIRGLIVPSQRIADQAKMHGYRQVWVAASARNEDTLQTLRGYVTSENDSQTIQKTKG